MSEILGSLKPQDQIILLLGQLQGQVTSMQQSVETSASSQAAVNAANEAEHAEFRRELANHSSQLAVVTATAPQRAPWWSIAAGLAAVGALILTIVNLFNR